jgi:threonine dehydrogenase-like Zn-dependent dehydrogenase
MRGAVMYGPGDVRLEVRGDPKLLEPTDAIIWVPATCICGSDLWPWRGVDDYGWPAPIGPRVRRDRRGSRLRGPDDPAG